MKNLKSNIFFKIGVIIVLTLILLIPTTLVQGLIHEREYVQSDAINEVSSKWGNSQTVTGPYISVPYNKYVKRVEDDSTYVKAIKEWAHFLPEQLTINGDVLPEKKHRGIFDVVVYQSLLNIDGKFNAFDFEALGISKKDVLYDQATLNVGISDLRGIETQIGLNWNKDESFFKPGTSTDDIVDSGINANVNVGAIDSSDYNFNLKLDLKGSQKLYFVPVGKTTDVHLTSSWASPKFTGAFLTDKNEVDENGFVADWKILNLNRNYPQSWTNNDHQVNSSKFGTELLLPVDGYTKSYRVARYSILFIVLTFMVFFFVEVMNKVFIHPIQYLLVGIALVVFYTLLLSISEHIAFNWAYIIAAGLTLTLITGYTMAIIKSKVVTVLISGILTMLYTFIFIIIQMEDLALLIGSLGIFLILAFVMYFSRKIDWYNIKMGKEEPKIIQENI